MVCKDCPNAKLPVPVLAHGRKEKEEVVQVVV